MKNIISNILLIFCALPLFAANSNEEENKARPDSILLACNMAVDSSRSAISADEVGSDVIDRTLSIDVGKGLYSKIAGLSVSQSGGLTIHGRSPLVIIDGFQRAITEVTPTEIESIQVLKDAVASSLYGVQGANGVVYITTKRSKVQPLTVTADYQFGFSTQYMTPEFADSYTYATSLNSALEMDNLSAKYSQYELDAFKNNTHPYEYPNVDWWDEIYNDIATNHRAKMSFSGGTESFKHYTSLDYMRDEEFFKTQNDDDRYNNAPTDSRLSLRSNMDVVVTPSTSLIIGVMAKMREINNYNKSDLYSVVYNTPSAAFPVTYRDGVYGGSSIYTSNNPVALLNSRGNLAYTYYSMAANANLHQDLGMFVKGLSADAGISFDYIGSMYDQSTKTYQYVDSNASILDDGTLVTSPVYYSADSAILSHSNGFNNINLNTTVQAKINYEYTDDLHDVRASLIYDQYAAIKGGRNQSISRQSAILFANYAYDSRYMVGLSTSYSGSSYLEPGNQFDVYPAINAGWVISQEEFMKSVDCISNLKIFASYGLSGYDANLSHELWRQSYDSTNAGTYYFTDSATAYYGKAEGDLAVENLKAEMMTKTTVGAELGLFDNRLSLFAEAFYEERSDILMDASSMVSSAIGIGVGYLNIGQYDYKGVDVALSWRDKVGDFSYEFYGTANFLTSEIVANNQAYQQYDYLYTTGNKVGQCYGLEAIGYFEDQTDINNSPVQSFSTVSPGDIKYRDQNGDNKIDSEDVVKMYESTTPELYYGFGFNLGYKGFELSATFQGCTGLTVNLLNSPLYQPLVSNGNISQSFLDTEIPWTEATKDIATMPRLTTLSNDNNYRNSSQWFRDGSFLKLRDLYFAYTIPKSVLKFASPKVYIQGSNLFSIDKLEIVDPEYLGAAYPLARTYYLGVKLNF